MIGPRWPTLARYLTGERSAAFAFAVANLVATSGLLLIPNLLHLPRATALPFTIAVISSQAAQGAIVQTGRNLLRESRMAAAAGVAVSGLAGAVPIFVPVPIIALSILSIIAGALFGAHIGAVAASQLLAGKPARYQLVTLSRSLVWSTIVLLTVRIGVNLLLSTAIAWLLMTIVSWRSDRAARQRSVSAGAAWVGVASGLLYRNDVSLARSMASGREFGLYNAAITGYSLVQAGIGFLVINEIFSRRDAIATSMTGRVLKSYVLINFTLLAFLTASGLWLASHRSLQFVLAAMVVVSCSGIAVSLQAAVAHALAGSVVVYVAGVVGIAALWISAYRHLPPAAGMSIELAVSGLIVGLALSFKSVRSATQKSV